MSGRFADAFGTLYLGYAVLWFYGQNKQVEGIDAVVELAMETLLKQNQAALQGIIPSSTSFLFVMVIMKLVCFYRIE